MTVPRRPRRRQESKSNADSGTALALVGMLAITGCLIGLGALVMPQIFGLIAVVFGFISFCALHYVLWGWWLKSMPPDEDDEDS